MKNIKFLFALFNDTFEYIELIIMESCWMREEQQ